MGVRSGFGKAVNRFWIRIYEKARGHLPEGYHDEVWNAYVQDRLEALTGTHGEEFVVWLTSDAVNTKDIQPRDFRDIHREIRHNRL